MANLQETPTWEAGIYQLETSDPVMGGENGIDNRAPRQLANRTLWLKNELARQIGVVNQSIANANNTKADKAVQFTAGNGLTGGGDLSNSRTLSLGTPSKITANSTNVAVSNTHSHEIDKASTTTQGIVQLNDTLTSTATNQALTANQGKILDEKITAVNATANTKANQSTTLTAGNGLTGGGTLQANRTVALGTPSQITATSTNSVTTTSHTHAIDKASTSVAGVVQLNDTLTSTATDQALTANQGKVLDESKLGNSGHQTINGQLGITRNAWEKLRFTNSDGSFWRFESAPISSSENGARFNWVFTGSDGTEVGRISFPRVSTGETIAYQSWVQTANVATATKLQTARNIAMTGDGSWNVNFDGSSNTTATMTLSNSGVTPGSYNAVTVDAKGRVTAGLTQTHGLVTATSATGTTNTATTNTNTFLNIVASGVGTANSVGSSTQITGTNGIGVSSDTAGKLIITQSLANSLTDTATNKALTAAQGKILNDGKFDKTGGEVSGVITFANQQNTLSTSTPTALSYGRLQSYSNLYINGNTDNSGDEAVVITSGKGLSANKNDGLAVGSNYLTWLGVAVATINSNVATATKLQTARNIALTGAVTGNVNFDGSGNVSLATTVQSVSGKVVIMTGTIEHGGTIPLPAGFNENQCKWMVSMNDDNPLRRTWDINEGGYHLHYRQECFTEGRVVTARTYLGGHSGSSYTLDSKANYIIIGVK